MLKGGFYTENTSNRFKMYMIDPGQLWGGELSGFHSIKKN